MSVQSRITIMTQIRRAQSPPRAAFTRNLYMAKKCG
jgi:hypothetical protein